MLSELLWNMYTIVTLVINIISLELWEAEKNTQFLILLVLSYFHHSIPFYGFPTGAAASASFITCCSLLTSFSFICIYTRIIGLLFVLYLSKYITPCIHYYRMPVDLFICGESLILGTHLSLLNFFHLAN